MNVILNIIFLNVNVPERLRITKHVHLLYGTFSIMFNSLSLTLLSRTQWAVPGSVPAPGDTPARYVSAWPARPTPASMVGLAWAPLTIRQSDLILGSGSSSLLP